MYVDQVFDKNNNWLYGNVEYCGDVDIIRISTKNIKGEKLSKDSITTTLFHELVHAILDRGQYFSSSEDEPLVEWLALCILTLKKQHCNI